MNNEIPQEVKNNIDELINKNDSSITTMLDKYRDLRAVCLKELDLEQNPNKIKYIKSKIEFYQTIVNYIETKSTKN